jgi:lipopolysaccharide transport system ATP-binding protein
MPVAIRVENLSKEYQLRHQRQERYVALRDVITNKVSGALKRIRNLGRPEEISRDWTEETFWALKDVNIEIAQGDRVGIIGRNGAGKSTLLKLMSRIVEPSSGRISLNGRISSLLEVGTGFHPELSGRENVFLNGAILGMRHQEIKKKFDEIVAFADVEKFLDTPVKHYSSGMYVRLAFAVSAHLDPDILLIDEVLAVGDAQFQKKCLEKMQEASSYGRTILFVSHSMGSVLTLCNRVVYLKDGCLVGDGTPSKIAQAYMEDAKAGNSNRLFDKALSGLRPLAIRGWGAVTGHDISPTLFVGDDLEIWILYETIRLPSSQVLFVFFIKDIYGSEVSVIHNELECLNLSLDGGGRLDITWKSLNLRPGRYSLHVEIYANNNKIDTETLGDVEVLATDKFFPGYLANEFPVTALYRSNWNYEANK